MRYVARKPQRLITNAILRRKRLNVWAGMGMGKTGATLDALLALSFAERIWPVLVIGPLRVAEVTWPDEVAKWDHLAHLRISAIVGTEAKRVAALRVKAEIYSVNFENVPWLVKRFKGKPWPFRVIVFDESTRLRGFRLKQGTAQAAALGKIAHVAVDRWINLTGTPAPNTNGLAGLWGQNWFVDQGERLGRTFGAFNDRWFQRGFEKIELTGGRQFNRPTLKPTSWAEEEIQGLLHSCTISLKTRDYYPDLREPIRNVIKVRLPAKAQLHYKQMEKDYFTEIRGHEIEAVHAASKSIKLLQIASGAVYDADRVAHQVHDEKLQALRSVVMEASGKPVLAVYNFKPTLARMQRGFNNGVLIKTAAAIKAWNEGQIELGFVHPSSIGHGISMQDGGNIIVHVDQWWDTEKHDQINERLGALRQLQSGYDRDVFEHYIVAEGTLDEDVLIRHSTNRSVQDILMDAMKARGF